MATELDIEMAAAAVEIVAESPRTITMLTFKADRYDPALGKQFRIPIKYPVVSSPPVNYRKREIDGDRIKTGDCKVFIPASNLPTGIKPNTNMRLDLDDGGPEWGIMDIEELSAGASVACYVLHLRR